MAYTCEAKGGAQHSAPNSMQRTRKRRFFYALAAWLALSWSAQLWAASPASFAPSPPPPSPPSSGAFKAVSGFYVQVGLGRVWMHQRLSAFQHDPAVSIKIPSMTQQLVLAYRWHRHWAAELGIDYVSPIKVQLKNAGEQRMHNNLVSLVGLYTVPLGARMGVSLMGGAGYVARHGVASGGVIVLPSKNIPTAVYGLKWQYALARRVSFYVDWRHANAQADADSPSMNVLTTGLAYHFGAVLDRNATDTLTGYQDPRPTPRRAVLLGFYDHRFWSPNIHRPPSPIMWHASTKADCGVAAEYLYRVIQSKHLFSLYAGLDGSWWSRQQRSLYIASAFFEIRLAPWRHTTWRPFFLWSIAGPSIMSSSHFGDKDLGGHFLWRDILGVGVDVGQTHPIELTARLQHYSNGDFLAKNPGFDIPIVLSVGYRF